jgi:hypothetical protein
MGGKEYLHNIKHELRELELKFKEVNYVDERGTTGDNYH